MQWGSVPLDNPNECFFENPVKAHYPLKKFQW
jgi:hypothetical protein